MLPSGLRRTPRIRPRPMPRKARPERLAEGGVSDLAGSWVSRIGLTGPAAGLVKYDREGREEEVQAGKLAGDNG